MAFVCVFLIFYHSLLARRSVLALEHGDESNISVEKPAEASALATILQSQGTYPPWEHNAADKAPDTLLVFTTANVLHKTMAMLTSLSTVHDTFDMLAIDEQSSDDTPRELSAYTVQTQRTKGAVGVTAMWNMAWRYVREHNYEVTIFSNNDVLVPDGVITKLRAALDAGCDLVSPLSTVRGKGHKGWMDGIEAVYQLDNATTDMVNHPANYQRVQDALDALYKDNHLAAVVDQEEDFNGFFFAVSARVQSAAFSDEALFDPELYNFHQEPDLTQRMRERGLRLCLHTGTFVAHFKGATIPMMSSRHRDNWRRTDF